MNIQNFYDRFAADSYVAPAILSISIMLFMGYLMTRITKRLKLPNVTAYIVAGILIGPYCLNLIPTKFIELSGFLPDIALAFIAFGTGQFFKLDVLKKNGIKVVIITLFEALMASLFVFVLCFFTLKLPFAFSAVIAALASATAPASTMMTIRQTNAGGEFVDTLLQVVALDDIVGLIAYSIAISVATASIAGEKISVFSTVEPFLMNLLVLVVGGLFGAFLTFSMNRRHSTDNRLIIAVAFLFTFCGMASMLQVSPLLGCMAMGTVYINLTDDDRLFKQLNYFNPPILLLFFVRSGVSFNLSALFNKGSFGAVPLIFVGIGYFLIRILGKYAGSYVGCALVGSGKKVRYYLGLALIPQAGVAIGLAELGARALKGEMGGALLTIILASSVLYELIGPAAAKFALFKSGAYGEDEETEAEIKEQPISDEIAEAYMPEAAIEKPVNVLDMFFSVSDPIKPRYRVIDVMSDDEYDVESTDEKSFDEGAEAYYQAQFKSEGKKKKKNKKKKDKNKKKEKDKKKK